MTGERLRFPPPPKGAPMSSPRPPILEQLHCLNKCSSKFPEQFNEVLHGKGYRKCVPNLQDDDSAWLVDYLDEVCCHTTTSPFYSLCLIHHRLLRDTSIPPVPLFESAYVNSETYVGFGGYSQHHSQFCTPPCTLVPSQLPQEVMVMCSREPSMVQGSVSNVCVGT